MLVLGIDPGSVKAGYGIIRLEGRKLHYVTSGVFKFTKEKDFFKRLAEISLSFKKLSGEVEVDEIALESLIYVKNPNSLLKLAQARGVIISQFLESHPLKIFEYSPNLIKAATVGHGHSDKQSIQKFIELYFGVSCFKSDDESDALAIAMCHALNRDKGSSINNNKAGRKSRSISGQLSHLINS